MEERPDDSREKSKICHGPEPSKLSHSRDHDYLLGYVKTHDDNSEEYHSKAPQYYNQSDEVFVEKLMEIINDPENHTDKKFWSQVYTKLGQKFSGIGDINNSYKYLKRAMEYDPFNQDAVACFTAILHVKILRESEKATENSASNLKKGGHRGLTIEEEQGPSSSPGHATYFSRESTFTPHTTAVNVSSEATTPSYASKNSKTSIKK